MGEQRPYSAQTSILPARPTWKICDKDYTFWRNDNSPRWSIEIESTRYFQSSKLPDVDGLQCGMCANVQRGFPRLPDELRSRHEPRRAHGRIPVDWRPYSTLAVHRRGAGGCPKRPSSPCCEDVSVKPPVRTSIPIRARCRCDRAHVKRDGWRRPLPLRW